ncbi:hypothetical protein BKA62DRAFT_690718 [Auriculariales sp. MPI-PUGE-AT-0066]|nr:hypothetical protein BKA62DRAFT_690718 [Auriculariales sp. MPI-PUGE-AT-0066]
MKHYKSQRRECNSPPAPRCKPLLLPDEILSELFHTAIACRMADMSLGRAGGRETANVVFVLAAVCSNWRAVTLAFPKLWSYICLDMARCVDWDVYADLMLDRAKAASITVVVGEALLVKVQTWFTISMLARVCSKASSIIWRWSGEVNRLPNGLTSHLAIDNVDSDSPASALASCGPKLIHFEEIAPYGSRFAYCSDRLRFHMARITMALGDAANCSTIILWTWSRTVQHWSSAVEWLAIPIRTQDLRRVGRKNERVFTKLHTLRMMTTATMKWLGGYKFVPNVRNMEFAITSWASPHEGRDTVIRFLRETKEDGPLTLDSLTFTLTLEPPLPHEIALFVSAVLRRTTPQVIRFRGFTSELLDMVMFEWMSIGCGLSVRTVIFVACEVDVERLDRFVKWKRRQNGWNEDVDAGTGLSVCTSPGCTCPLKIYPREDDGRFDWAIEAEDSGIPGFDSLVFHNTRLIRDWERNWVHHCLPEKFGNTYRVSVGTSELMEKSKEVRVVSKFSVIFKTMIRGGCRWSEIDKEEGEYFFFGQMEDDSAT